MWSVRLDVMSGPLRESRLAREGAVRPTLDPVPGCAGGYLVARGRAGTFRERVEELDGELGDAEITCTGPWPPYSFSQAPEAAA